MNFRPNPNSKYPAMLRHRTEEEAQNEMRSMYEMFPLERPISEQEIYEWKCNIDDEIIKDIIREFYDSGLAPTEIMEELYNNYRKTH